MVIVVSTILLIFIMWTLLNSMFMPRLPMTDELTQYPLVSILIPLRNEEANVASLVANLRQLSYPSLEILFLDDQSTDQTKQLLTEAIQDDTRFQYYSGSSLRENWVGKVFACHQLQQLANGKYLLFLDADVRLAPPTIEKALSLMMKKNAQLLTGFSAFVLPNFLSTLFIPLQHFVTHFHLPLFVANYTRFVPATAAHGAFMFFEKEAYQSIGGHEAVAFSLVEDVHIARQMKKEGYRVILANITDDVSCQMYDHNQAVWQGFLKNTYNGLGKSPLLVMILTLFYAFFYVLPGFWLLFGIATFDPMYFIPYGLTVIHRAIVDWQTNQRWQTAFWMPVSAVALITLMHASMWKSITKQSYEWKGRSYS